MSETVKENSNNIPRIKGYSVLLQNVYATISNFLVVADTYEWANVDEEKTEEKYAASEAAALTKIKEKCSFLKDPKYDNFAEFTVLYSEYKNEPFFTADYCNWINVVLCYIRDQLSPCYKTYPIAKLHFAYLVKMFEIGGFKFEPNKEYSSTAEDILSDMYDNEVRASARRELTPISDSYILPEKDMIDEGIEYLSDVVANNLYHVLMTGYSLEQNAHIEYNKHSIKRILDFYKNTMTELGYSLKNEFVREDKGLPQDNGSSPFSFIYLQILKTSLDIYYDDSLSDDDKEVLREILTYTNLGLCRELTHSGIGMDPLLKERQSLIVQDAAGRITINPYYNNLINEPTMYIKYVLSDINDSRITRRQVRIERERRKKQYIK